MRDEKRFGALMNCAARDGTYARLFPGFTVRKIESW